MHELFKIAETLPVVIGDERPTPEDAQLIAAALRSVAPPEPVEPEDDIVEYVGERPVDGDGEAGSIALPSVPVTWENIGLIEAALNLPAVENATVLYGLRAIVIKGFAAVQGKPPEFWYSWLSDVSALYWMAMDTAATADMEQYAAAPLASDSQSILQAQEALVAWRKDLDDLQAGFTHALVSGEDPRNLQTKLFASDFPNPLERHQWEGVALRWKLLRFMQGKKSEDPRFVTVQQAKSANIPIKMGAEPIEALVCVTTKDSGEEKGIQFVKLQLLHASDLAVADLPSNAPERQDYNAFLLAVKAVDSKMHNDQRLFAQVPCWMVDSAIAYFYGEGKVPADQRAAAIEMCSARIAADFSTQAEPFDRLTEITTSAENALDYGMYPLVRAYELARTAYILSRFTLSGVDASLKALYRKRMEWAALRDEAPAGTSIPNLLDQVARGIVASKTAPSTNGATQFQRVNTALWLLQKATTPKDPKDADDVRKRSKFKLALGQAWQSMKASMGGEEGATACLADKFVSDADFLFYRQKRYMEVVAEISSVIDAYRSSDYFKALPPNSRPIQESALLEWQTQSLGRFKNEIESCHTLEALREKELAVFKKPSPNATPVAWMRHVLTGK